MHDRQRIRSAGGLRFERLVQARLVRIIRPQWIPPLQQLLPLGCIQQIDLLDRLGRIVYQRFQHAMQITDMPFDRGAIEQGGGVAQLADDAVADFAQIQFLIELGDFVIDVGRNHRQAGQIQIDRFVVLPDQHHLEDRRMRQAARRLDGFHHMLERHILIGLRIQRAAFGLRQQIGKRAGHAHPQCLGIDKETDQSFDFGTRAVRRRRTDHHIVLT